MDALMFIFLAISSFAAVIVQDQDWLDIDPGILGLALSMLIQLSGLFQWCIRQVGWNCLLMIKFDCYRNLFLIKVLRILYSQQKL